MVTTTPTRTAPGRAAATSNGRVPATLDRPRRNPLFIVAGAFLVVVLALAFMWIQLRFEQSVSVLVVARPVPAGQTITSADLRVASVVPDPSVGVVAESQADTVVGRTAAVPLVPGALLSPDQIGPVAFPAAGDAVVALPVKPGRVPTGVTPGARVRVLTIATDTATAAGTGQPAGVVATVVDVASNVDASGAVVVSLLLRGSDAGIAAAGGEATLVLLGPAG